MKIFLIFAMAAVLLGCKEETSYVIDEIPEEGILLNKWQILGPFSSNGKEHALDNDDLRHLGFDESAITYDEFVHIRSTDSSHLFTNQFVVSDNYKIDFNKLYRYTDSTAINGNVYCACILTCKKEKKLKLNFSSDDGSKIWLNHKLIHSYEKIGGIKYYDRYIDLPLLEGRNLLLIKVHNARFGWEMFALVEEESKWGRERHLTAFSVEFGNYYLRRSVISNDLLLLNESLPPEEYTFTVAAQRPEFNIHESIHKAQNPVWNISGLKNGLYSSTLLYNEKAFSESFYKGDIEKAIHRVLKTLSSYRVTAAVRRNIGALTYRFRHLLKPENRGKDLNEKRDWDKKMIFLFSNLTHYSLRLKKGLDPEASLRGGTLKSYISCIDNGIQYYQLYVPRNYRNGTPLPLIIELPKFMTRHPSPLETYRFANIRLFELFEDLADKYNVFILDPGCRTIDQSNRNTIDEADFWEAVGEVRKYYSIDTTRMYLRGACLSSRSAMKLAVKYPDRFAALAMVAPELVLSTNENLYVQQNEPTAYFKNIRSLPIYMIHSRLDPHSPVSISDKFHEDTRNAGFKQVLYRRLFMEFKTYYSEEYMEDIFRFFLQYELQTSPKEIFFSTSQLKYNKSFWLTLNKIDAAKKATVDAAIDDNTLTIHKENIDSYTIDLRTLPYRKEKRLILIDNGKTIFSDRTKEQSLSVNLPEYSRSPVKNKNIEGPFAHIFSTPFILVAGTTGTLAENKTLQAIGDTLNKYWKMRYYTGCRVKRDKEIKKKDLENYSLLLLGTPQSNSVFKKYEHALPIKITPASIEIGGSKASGSGLCFYSIYPHPGNSTKYVAIIGYNNPSTFGLGNEEDCIVNYFNDVSNYGWYDYKIWDGITSHCICSGYFDFSWK